MHLKLSILEDVLSIIRLSPTSKIPDWIFHESFYSICKTEDELSIVVRQTDTFDDVVIEKDWRAFKVLGPLEFSLTGILSELSTILADESISIFAISTYDTDYILVKSKDLEKAKQSFIRKNVDIL